MNDIHSRVASAEDLIGLDLNLLVAFDALARERSVTRAAHRLAVTQSAMSHTLRRLRALFGDPLLVRGRGGMLLTPRAQSLVLPLRSGLVALSRALAQPAQFEPSCARRAFRLATPDLFNILAVPALLERVRQDAPYVDIALVPLSDQRLPDQLETGDVDVAIVPWMQGVTGERSRVAPGLVRSMIFRDRFVTLIRAEHPALQADSRLSLETFAKLSHALVSPSGDGEGAVDVALKEHGLERRIALRVPDFYSALAIIARSDLILTAPSALARVAPRDFDIISLPPPLRLPGHSINLIWHERFTKDPGHAWLRSIVATSAKPFGIGKGESPSC